MRDKILEGWRCYLCTRKPFTKKGWLIRHLVSVHRKQRYPKDETLKSAIDIASECGITNGGQNGE